MAAPDAWLVLIYRIPSEPSRLRAGVWRKLKTLGAVYLQNSVAAFPATPAGERTLRALRKEIEEMGGAAILQRGEMLAGRGEAIASFNAARDEEYAEVVTRCRDFLAEIERETAAEHFTYAELEENDEDLAKLRRWNEKVRARDLLDAPGAAAAGEALERCSAALDRFADRVYEAEAPDT